MCVCTMRKSLDRLYVLLRSPNIVTLEQSLISQSFSEAFWTSKSFLRSSRIWNDVSIPCGRTILTLSWCSRSDQPEKCHGRGKLSLWRQQAAGHSSNNCCNHDLCLDSTPTQRAPPGDESLKGCSPKQLKLPRPSLHSIESNPDDLFTSHSIFTPLVEKHCWTKDVPQRNQALTAGAWTVSTEYKPFGQC